ncbi:uncharacterized protein LOC118735843 [Rhagoletis pomonella]|uniref:uncharacterized protein LOC118735843 n=1 Tax=Rhagoletis pomonella TaxID=28610 RepID=UPI00178414D3|nr:uncharacterized protein LOC118735843 [Rhagoletis pomonella]
MLKNFSLLALATLLLVQFTTCLPMPSSSESEETNTIPQRTTAQTTTPAPPGHTAAQKRLEALVYKSYSNLLNFQLQRSNQIAKDVLADPSMNNIVSDAMENEKRQLEKFVKDSKESLLAALPANKNDQQNRFFFAIGKGFVIEEFEGFARRRASKTEELTPEQQVSWNALEKHGFQEYKNDLEKRADEFSGYLVDEFGNFIKTLTPAEKEKEKDMVEVWNMYTNNVLGLSKTEFGQRLFGLLFQYETKY